MIRSAFEFRYKYSDQAFSSLSTLRMSVVEGTYPKTTKAQYNEGKATIMTLELGVE